MPVCSIFNCVNEASCKPQACFCAVLHTYCEKLNRFIECLLTLKLRDADVTTCWKDAVNDTDYIEPDLAPFKEFLLKDDNLPMRVFLFLRQTQNSEPLSSRYYNRIYKNGICDECFSIHFQSWCDESCSLLCETTHKPREDHDCFFCKQSWDYTRTSLFNRFDKFLNLVVDTFIGNSIYRVVHFNQASAMFYSKKHNFFLMKRTGWEMVKFSREDKAVHRVSFEPFKTASPSECVLSLKRYNEDASTLLTVEKQPQQGRWKRLRPIEQTFDIRFGTIHTKDAKLYFDNLYIF